MTASSRAPSGEGVIGVEEVARAICVADDETWPDEWDAATTPHVVNIAIIHRMRLARAAISAYLEALRAAGQMIISVADYKRLLEAAESDDMIEWCEVCGAWLDKDDPARASVEDFTGCWKAARLREGDDHLCRSYRALG